jgi:hypothetical protein
MTVGGQFHASDALHPRKDFLGPLNKRLCGPGYGLVKVTYLNIHAKLTLVLLSSGGWLVTLSGSNQSISVVSCTFVRGWLVTLSGFNQSISVVSCNE